MFKDDFLAYLRAGFPLLYVVTHEEQRALKDCADKKFKQFVWTGTDGLKGDKGTKIGGGEDPTGLWGVIPSLEENSVVYLLDYHFFIESPDTIRKIKDVLPVMKAKGQHAVIVSCRTVLPPELEKDCVVMNFGLPQKDDLRKILNYVFQSAGAKADSKNHDRVLEASLGMTANEAESVYSLAMIKFGGKIDSAESVELIQKEKTAIIKKSGLLEFYDCKEDMGSVGGLDLLKAWLARRQKGFSKEAREFGLSYPKGILLCGVPGTGKSLTAKAVAREWGLPLLKFDLGKMFGSLVGQSLASWEEIVYYDDSGIAHRCTIEELYKKFPHDNIFVETIADDMKIARKLVKNIFCHPLKGKLLKVKSRLGKEVSITEDHSLFTLGEKGEFKNIAGNELKIGIPIAIPMNGIFQNIVSEMEIIRNASFCELAGWWIAEGDWSKSRQVRLSITNDESVFLESLAKECGIGIKSYKTIDNHTVAFLAPKWTDVWFNMGLHGKSHERRIPEWVFSLSRENLGRLLKGYFSGDGSVESGRNISVTSVSKKLMGDISFLMSRLGIIGKIRERDERIVKIKNKIAYGKKRYVYTISSPEMILRFSERVGFSGKKDEKLQNVLKFLSNRKMRGFGNIAFPFTQAVKEEVKRIRNGLYKQKAKDMRHCGKRISIKYLERKIKDSQIKSWLSEISGWDVYWDEVSEIKEMDKVPYVYDISVEETERFISGYGGIMVHNSEERVRQATALADAIGNCILWIEEIEKGLAGIASSGHTDSGVTARVFGTLLTWLNEKKGGAFVVATANDIGRIPAEFLRKGRWDELFFVNLPTSDEREAILKIHLAKRKKEISDNDVKDISRALPNFSGAEIESLIEEAMFTAFDEGRELVKNDLLKAAKETRTLYQTAPERIEAIRDWGKKYARPASTPHELAEEMEKLGSRKLDIS